MRLPIVLLLTIVVSGCVTKPMVGSLVHVDRNEVVVGPQRGYVRTWPSDPEVKKKLAGEPELTSDRAKIIFETTYDSDPTPGGYWHNRKMFIVESAGRYFLVTEQGVTPTRK